MPKTIKVSQNLKVMTKTILALFMRHGVLCNVLPLLLLLF